MMTTTQKNKVESLCMSCSWNYHTICLNPKGKLGECPFLKRNLNTISRNRERTDLLKV
jgi:hypothetical protein